MLSFLDIYLSSPCLEGQGAYGAKANLFGLQKVVTEGDEHPVENSSAALQSNRAYHSTIIFCNTADKLGSQARPGCSGLSSRGGMAIPYLGQRPAGIQTFVRSTVFSS